MDIKVKDILNHSCFGENHYTSCEYNLLFWQMFSVFDYVDWKYGLEVENYGFKNMKLVALDKALEINIHYYNQCSGKLGDIILDELDKLTALDVNSQY